MPTVIDSLIMELGLDNKLFKTGIKDSEKAQDEFRNKSTAHAKKSEVEEKRAEAEKKRRHLEEVRHHRETLENYKKLREDLIKFFLIFTAGREIGEFISDTIKSTVEMGHLGHNIGMAAEEVAGLGMAFKEMGGDAEDANNLLRKAYSASAAMRIGQQNEQSQGLFTGAGQTGVNLKGAGTNTMSFLKAQADVAHAISVKFPKEGLAIAMMRMKITEKEYNLLKGGAHELEKKIAAGAKISGIDHHGVVAAERMLEQWVHLVAKLEGLGRKMLMPFLEKLAHWMEDKDNFKRLSDGMEKFAIAVANIQWERLFQILGEVLEIAGRILSYIKPADNALGVALEGGDSINAINEKRHTQNGLSMDYLRHKFPSLFAQGGNQSTTLNLTVNAGGEVTKQKVTIDHSKSGSSHVINARQAMTGKGH